MRYWLNEKIKGNYGKSDEKVSESYFISLSYPKLSLFQLVCLHQKSNTIFRDSDHFYTIYCIPMIGILFFEPNFQPLAYTGR